MKTHVPYDLNLLFLDEDEINVFFNSPERVNGRNC